MRAVFGIAGEKANFKHVGVRPAARAGFHGTIFPRLPFHDSLKVRHEAFDGREGGRGGGGVTTKQGTEENGKERLKDEANGVLPVPVLVNVAAGSEEMKGAAVPTVIRAITAPMAIFLEKKCSKT